MPLLWSRNLLRAGFVGLAILALSAPTSAQQAAPALPKPPAGMAAYEFGILRRGVAIPNEPAGEREKRQKGHLENMEKMAAEGLLIGAGPIMDKGDIRGIFIFPEGKRARIDEMVKADPMLSSGVMTFDIHPWWGPAGIGDAYFAEHKANPQAKDRMKTYYLAFLTAGPNRKGDEDAETKKIQEGHMAHIRSMAETGKLVAAGPFLDDGNLRGIFLFDVPSREAAEALAAEDPAVKAGRLVLDIHPWMVAEGVFPEPKKKQ